MGSPSVVLVVTFVSLLLSMLPSTQHDSGSAHTSVFWQSIREVGGEVARAPLGHACVFVHLATRRRAIRGFLVAARFLRSWRTV